VYRYHDAQTDDAALTRAVMQSAIGLGATLACPAEFIAASINRQGSEISYRQDGEEKSCCTRALVNAAGPWAGEVDARITPAPAPVLVDLVQGTHLILPEPLEQGCYYMEAVADRRAVFLLPWGEHSLLGTTENLYRGDPAGVQALPAEESYLLAVLQQYFPGRSTRVVDRFAGLRVLPASGSTAFRRTRETHLPVDDPRQPYRVSIYGGKLTGYRATAHKVLQLLQRSLPARKAIADTTRLPLHPV